jgi:hypothetical protein
MSLPLILACALREQFKPGHKAHQAGVVRPCAGCTRKLLIGPAGQAVLKANPDAETRCPACLPPPDEHTGYAFLGMPKP